MYDHLKLKPREEPGHTATCMCEHNQGILSNRKDILSCPQEGETEENEAWGMWELGPVSIYLHLNPFLLVDILGFFRICDVVR